MYAFVDRPVIHLCDGGRFLLWAMRAWSQAATSRTCPPKALRRGFACMGLLEMLPDIHLAMALLHQDQSNPFGMAPIGCRHIAEDEAVMLSLWRDLSLDDNGNARKTLALFVEQASVIPIVRAMTFATAAMVGAGFDLSGLSIPITKETKSSDE